MQVCRLRSVHTLSHSPLKVRLYYLLVSLLNFIILTHYDSIKTMVVWDKLYFHVSIKANTWHDSLSK